MGFGRAGRRADFLQAVFIQRAGAAPFHLFEIVAAFDIAHKQQAFERAHVGAGGDHVDGNGNARVVAVAEVGQHGFRLFALFDDFAVFVHNIVFGFIGDFFAEFVALSEFFAHHFDDVVGVAVVFGKNQGFGHFLAVGEDDGQMVAESADNGADLAEVDNVPIQLFGGVGFVGVLLLPAFATGGALAVLHQFFGFEFAALLADFGVDQIHFVAHIHAVGHGLFVAVFAHYVLVEKAEGSVIGGGG